MQRGGHALTVHVGDRKRHANLFGNGTLTVRGCGSLAEAREVLGELRERVATVAKVREGFLDVKIKNIVATLSLGTSIDLSRIVEALPIGEAVYEPEEFPGLILRKSNEKVVVLVFHSGKLVIVGTRSRRELERVASRTFAFFTDLGLLNAGRGEMTTDVDQSPRYEMQQTD